VGAGLGGRTIPLLHKHWTGYAWLLTILLGLATAVALLSSSIDPKPNVVILEQAKSLREFGAGG